MSEYNPLVSWETKLIDVQPVLARPFHYICKVSSVNPNDYDPNELGENGTLLVPKTDRFYIVDYTGKIYQIKYVVDVPTKTVEIYDLTEDADEGPYITESAFVYQTRKGRNVLTQAQRKRLHPSAYDQILNIENNYLRRYVDWWEFDTTLDNPPYQKGLKFWDKNTNSMSYYNEIEGITVNESQEFLIPVYNNTASTIPNGSVVYPTGSFELDGIVRHTVDLASAKYKDKSRVVAVTTNEMLPNTPGYVTRLGSISGLNTSGLNGIIYLSATTPGAFTNVIPDDGAYIIPVGAVKVIDAVNGSITVDPKTTDLTVEVTDTNGFPPTQRTNTLLSFVDNGGTPETSRIFTIAATSYPFHYYDEGIKYEKEAPESIQITDVEGVHVLYYEDSVLSTLANPNAGQIDTLIRTACLIAYVYWDADNNVHTYFGDERHGISMAPDTHTYLHFTRGAQYLYGLGLGDILADENGSLASHAQFSIEGGMTTDEDITTTLSAIASTVGLPIYYLSGANAAMRRTTQVGFSVKTTGTGRLAYNQWTGATWQLTEVTDGKYVLCHVLSVNGLAGTDQQIAIIGQAEYLTSADARAAASTEIASVVTRFPFQETIAVATVIFQTKDSYVNSINARIISTAEGTDYINWLTTELSTGSAPTSHSNLTNLTADDHPGHPWLLGRTGGQTLIGGTGVTDKLSLQGTSGDGTLTSPAIDFKVGNNGATLAGSILNNGKWGINHNVPTERLDIYQGNLNFKQATNATAATATIQAGGNIDIGTHKYMVRYEFADGTLSGSSAVATVVITAGNNTVYLTNIPISTDVNCTKRLIYRTKAATPNYYYYLLTTITDNVTTIYTDTVTDASLGSTILLYDHNYTPNTTGGIIKINTVQALLINPLNTYLGSNAGGTAQGVFYNTAKGINSLAGLTTINSSNTAVGTNSGQYVSTNYSCLFGEGVGQYAGSGTSAFGFRSLRLSTGSYNTAFGYMSGYSITSSGRSLFLGMESGYYETSSNRLFIDNQKRADINDARVKAFMYGIFDAITTNQILNLNANLNVRHTLTVDTIGEFTAANGVWIDGLGIKDTGINFEVGATTRIFKDGSNNLSFTDAVAGTYTLQQLAATPPSEYLVRVVTQAAHGFTNDFVYHNGTIWTKAQADTAAKCATHYAERIGDNTFSLIPVGEVNVGSLLDENGDALVTGNYYFLSQTVAGKVTTLKPTDNIVQSLLKVNETDKVMISIQEPYDINDTGGGSMIYPGAGIPLSTGSAWGTSIVLGTSTTTFLRNDGTWDTPAGSSVSFGTDYQIPFMKTTDDDFQYSANFKWDGIRLHLTTGSGWDNLFIGEDAGPVALNSIIDNIGIGIMSLNALTGSAAKNVMCGVFSGLYITSGSYNVGYGTQTCGQVTTGNCNTAVGTDALYNNLTGSNNVAIGYNAGLYETSSNILFIDNQDRTDEATSRTSSLIYGKFNSTIANQFLRINGQFQLIDGITAPATVSGYAQIYVDVADGDLKVKFGDGTVKTIVTDT